MYICVMCINVVISWASLTKLETGWVGRTAPQDLKTWLGRRGCVTHAVPSFFGVGLRHLPSGSTWGVRRRWIHCGGSSRTRRWSCGDARPRCPAVASPFERWGR